MFKNKKQKAVQDSLKGAEVGLNTEPNAITRIYSEVKKAGTFTSEYHDQFIKEGLNILLAIAKNKGMSMSIAKADLMAGKMTFKDVADAVASLGGDPFAALSEMGSEVKMDNED